MQYGEKTNRLPGADLSGMGKLCKDWKTGNFRDRMLHVADGDEAVMMLDKECRIRHNPDHELVNRLKTATVEYSVENVQH